MLVLRKELSNDVDGNQHRHAELYAELHELPRDVHGDDDVLHAAEHDAEQR
jgi:hypothetical protein